MKKLFVFTLTLLIPAMLLAQQPNTITSKEKRDGWILLFNGKDFSGWRQYNGTQMAPNWTIEDGAMKVATSERPGRAGGGDIIFDQVQFSNFELSLDWKVEKEGNSGIFYYVVEEQGKPIYYAAPEVQILDNVYASDNKLENHLAGSLYDMLAAVPQNANPYGEWNNIVIKVQDGKVTHTQNGVQVVEYTLWGPEWKELVAKSKFAEWPGFKNGPAKSGYIGLQDHGWATWFRNIKIKRL